MLATPSWSLVLRRLSALDLLVKESSTTLLVG
jgi:hypothetical protein